jgi:hypothetical protein
MGTNTTPDTAPTEPEQAKRTRRAEPITKYVAQSGKVSYWFQVNTGTRPDGSRDRRRYTYPTLAEARREFRRIFTEAVAGTLVKRDKVTVREFLTEWLDSRRVRHNTLDGYRAALKPLIEHLGTVPLQHLDTPHLDELVTLRLTGTPLPARAKRGRRSTEVLAYLRQRGEEGAGYSELLAAFGEPGIKALDRLLASGDVLRPKRGRYVAAQPAESERPKVPGGVSNLTVCAMLTVLSSALTSAMKRGLVARNVATLVDRPAIGHREMSTWTPPKAERFRNHVHGDRLNYGGEMIRNAGAFGSGVTSSPAIRHALSPGIGEGSAGQPLSFPASPSSPNIAKAFGSAVDVKRAWNLTPRIPTRRNASAHFRVFAYP